MKKIGLFLCVVAMAALLVNGSLTVTAQGAKLSGVVRVGSWDSAEALEPFNRSIESFKALYPDIEVKLESVPQDYGTKLLAQFAAGTAPDVFQTGDGDVAKFQALGAVEDLGPYINGSDPLDMGVFFPAVAAFGNVAGNTYYLTKDYSPLVMFYNKAHLKEAGVAEPTADWTFEQMLDMAQTLTVDANGNNAKSANFDPNNIQRWGLQIPNSWGDLYWERGILPVIYAFGGKLVSDDGKTTTGYMNSEETVAALQWYVDLVKKHHVSPSKADIDARAGADLFQSGVVSMLWNGRWPIKDFMRNTDLDFGTMGLPAGKAGHANVLCWAGFSMYSKSQNKDAAWAFLKHIAAGEGAKAFADYAFTAVQSISEAQGLATDKYNAPIITDLANVKSIPEATTQYWGDCGNLAFKTEMEQIFLNDVAVKDAMDKAAADADACLAKKAAGQ